MTKQEFKRRWESDDNGGGLLFSDIANELAKSKLSSHQYPPFIGSYCKDCKFRDKDKQKSGMHECWKQLKRFTNEKFNSEKVIDIWNIRNTKKLLEQDKFFIDDLEPLDLKIEDEPYLSDKLFSNKDRSNGSYSIKVQFKRSMMAYLRFC